MHGQVLTAGLQCPNPIIPNVDLSMAGEYTVTMVYDGETAVASTTVVITVAPNVVVTPSVQSICDGGSATYGFRWR